MEIYIFNKERTLAGIIESYDYLRWSRNYSKCGSFELKAIANENNIALLKTGNILWKSDDEEAGIIEFLEMTMQESEFIRVSGRFATSFLARRIVWDTEILKGDLSNCVAQLLNNNLIAPSEISRKISGISYNPQSIGKEINTQVSYKNLMDAISGLCEAADIGIKTVFNPTEGLFEIVLYEGDNSLPVFSEDYENILEQIFTESEKNYANLALVGGEGEGAERIFQVSGDASAEERYEIFVDAKDLRAEDFPDNYNEALFFRGDTKLSELAKVKAFEVVVNQYGNLSYKTDFDLGSMICVISGKWGIKMNVRITEVEETYDRDGMSLSLTFGKALISLNEKILEGA